MPTTRPFRLRLTLIGLFIALALNGCVSIGEGLTEREFDAGLEGLAVGMTPEAVLASLGEPREKRPAADPEAATSVWVYSRFEVVGTRTVINEGAIGAAGAGIPTFEEEDITANVEFHLHWRDDELVSWERVEPRRMPR